MLMLIQKIGKLEQEVRHLQEREIERQRIQDLETIITKFLQRLNMAEHEHNYFREIISPQGHQIDQLDEAHGGHEAVPMEIEENTHIIAGRHDM